MNNKNKKAIFFDVDGTLLGRNTKDMSESTKEAIRVARANGHICMINTGRTKGLVGPDLTGQVEFDGILMGCGMMAEYGGDELFYVTLSYELSVRLLEALKRYNIDAVLEGREGVYGENPENVRTETFKHFYKGYAGRNINPMEQAPGNFDKMLAYTDNQEDMERFRREFMDEMDFIDRGDGFREIVLKGYSKGTGLVRLAQILNIPMENTVAVGDSGNDLSMLQCAGTGIAMGNSTKELLEIADYVTTDVDEDGIWNALKWLGVLDE